MGSGKDHRPAAIDRGARRPGLGQGEVVRLGLDTSVLVRLLTGLPEEQASVARNAIERALASGDEVVVADLVLAETCFAQQFHDGVPKPSRPACSPKSSARAS
jgi:hypothetical protein